jgi:hypothetical protein
MMDKIISGGQTGADQAALDVAVKYNIPHGGWIPMGRRTEAGPLPSRYRLAVMPTCDYRDRTRQNVLDSQGTVIFYRRHLTGGSRLTLDLAQTEGKPCVAVDLWVNDPFEAAVMLQSFVVETRIRVLNVAGPRASHDPGIYADVKMILETVVYMQFMAQEKKWPHVFAPCSDPVFPDRVDAAVDLLTPDLPLKAKTDIARLDPTEIDLLYFSWLEDLRFRLGLDAGNRGLLDDCRQREKLDYFTVEDAVMAVIKAVKSACDQACQLRIIK